MLKHRKDYVDLHCTTESERDSIEHEVELTSLLDAVQETEIRMVKMSALNHLMATHVLQQAQQIEQLYNQAVEATHNVNLGNEELSKAIQRNTSSSTFLLLFLFVLTFSILFLDWYS
ncbi:hypothetical protein M0R45_034593 [Rubus argutus]|uniref:Syntaxin-81 n=1 Tax=Rubus argutus TaxID=59490 RepID=A0AAW1VTJ1_RUBAR